VTFAPLPLRQVERYGAAIREGVLAAAARFEQTGGTRQWVHVDEMVESMVDTTEDAVRCAATLAAWKSFGRDESEAVLSFQDGNWHVSF
jgi:hypothetical protein